jgi:hypothetical protein
MLVCEKLQEIVCEVVPGNRLDTSREKRNPEGSRESSACIVCCALSDFFLVSLIDLSIPNPITWQN